MGTFGIHLLLAFLQFTLARCLEPEISYISQEQIKDIGDTVELQCAVKNAHDFPVRWVKAIQDPELISIGTALTIHNSRFSVRYDDSEIPTYTLQIKNIQETDAAPYQCELWISLNNTILAGVELQVRRPPIISDNSTSSLTTSEHQSVQLQCYASGYPHPRISWRRENNEILPTGGTIYRGNTLEISSVRKEDRGAYFCVAENGVGKAVRRKIAVTVEFAPVITLPRERVGQALQYDADLECFVEAYPPPAIFWFRGDTQLINNQSYIISQFSTADDFYAATIRVITIDEWRYGTYVCQANNKLGLSESSIELFETIDPICPPACGIKRNTTTETPLSSSEPSTTTTTTEPYCTSTPSPPSE